MNSVICRERYAVELIGWEGSGPYARGVDGVGSFTGTEGAGMLEREEIEGADDVTSPGPGYRPGTARYGIVMPPVISG